MGLNRISPFVCTLALKTRVEVALLRDVYHTNLLQKLPGRLASIQHSPWFSMMMTHRPRMTIMGVLSMSFVSPFLDYTRVKLKNARWVAKLLAACENRYRQHLFRQGFDSEGIERLIHQQKAIWRDAMEKIRERSA